jgi:ubiquinone/menaquinone biosynthesis C-methylase UbiE
MKARWQRAQRLELDFWARWKSLAPYQNLDIPAYWRDEDAHFGVPWSIFDNLRVLDVGCGPFGLIHYLDHASERIRLDPLLTQYKDKLPLQGLSLEAMAESLPLATHSVDLAICYNALDHMLDPAAALDELARVLGPRASALLMIHTFPAWLRPFYAIDRMHPHHFTAEAFQSLIESRFKIESCKTLRRHFAPTSWKYRLANQVVSTTYIHARLPPPQALNL